MPEGRRIFAPLSVKENLMTGAYTRTDKKAIEQTMESVFMLFPRLKERFHQRAGTLSGGEQQMLAVGRAMMSPAQAADAGRALPWLGADPGGRPVRGGGAPETVTWA